MQVSDDKTQMRFHKSIVKPTDNGIYEYADLTI